MKNYWLAGGLTLALSSFFIVAWLGALIGRSDRPVGKFIDRHGKVLAIGLWLFHILLTYFNESKLLDGLDSLVVLVLIAMFVPLLRRLEKSAKSA